jgi:hypothetical protein
MQISTAAALQFHIVMCVAAISDSSVISRIMCRSDLALRLAQIASQDLSFLTSPNFLNGTDGQHTKYADGQVASTRHSA